MRFIETLIPYFLAHWKARRMYFQHVRGKKGSPSHTSIAHHGIANRIQFNPAPAISAKSCSVWMAGNVVNRHRANEGSGRAKCGVPGRFNVP